MSKGGMFNLGHTTSQTLIDNTFTFSAGTASAPMTLSERVDALFEQLHIPVFRYVLRKMRNPGRAEEVTQETFLRLFRYLKEGRSLDNPKAWLFTVAHNLAIDGSTKFCNSRTLPGQSCSLRTSITSSGTSSIGLFMRRGEYADEVLDQQRDVLDALAQGRKIDWDHVKAVVQPSRSNSCS
jgi:hypothetical protein